MITVKQLINDLKKYPMEAKVYAYEGERIGVIIVTESKTECLSDGSPDYEQLGFINTGG